MRRFDPDENARRYAAALCGTRALRQSPNREEPFVYGSEFDLQEFDWWRRFVSASEFDQQEFGGWRQFVSASEFDQQEFDGWNAVCRW